MGNDATCVLYVSTVSILNYMYSKTVPSYPLHTGSG